MTDITAQLKGFRIPSHALIAFFALTFAITWGVVGAYIFLPELASAAFGEISGSHPLYFLATWAPAISAFALMFYLAGIFGIRALFSRLFIWRCPHGWVAFILVGVPLIYVAGSLLNGGRVLAPLPSEGIGAMVALSFMMLFLGPIEEFGWRGVAQPLLQRHMAPVWAGVIIGTAWGIWHLPAFFLSGTVYGSWNFFPFLVGNIALAVLVTPIFNASRGSILWPLLFHWQLIIPFWPDARPYDTWIFAAIAMCVVWWKRDMMFSRNGAVTEVIPGENSVAP